jgi:hypothetical protein
MKLGSLFRELTEQALTIFGRKAIGYPNQFGFFRSGGFQHLLNGNCRSQKHGAPACRFSQMKKIRHTRHMDALAQRGGNHSLHDDLLLDSE